jgi:hypothetical protein
MDSGGKDQDDESKRSDGHCSLCGAALPIWALRAPRRWRGAGRRAPRPPRGPPG